MQAIWMFLIQNARFLNQREGGTFAKPVAVRARALCRLGMGFCGRGQPS